VQLTNGSSEVVVVVVVVTIIIVIVNIIIFVVFVLAQCMLIVLRPLFVQLLHTDYYKIVEQLKSFKIIKLLQHVSVYINHHQGGLSLYFAKVTMLTSVTYRYLKLSVLWLRMQPQYR